MRDYQPVKNNKYQLEPEIYKLMIHVIRSYPYLKKKSKNHSYIPAPDLEAIGSGNSVKSVKKDDIERQVIILANADEKINAVDKALNIVPDEYRKPILDNIIKSKPWYTCDYASPETLRRHKSRFIYKLAYELNYI